MKIINSYYDIIYDLSSKLKECRCPICGGTFEEYTCSNCGKENADIKKLIESLSNVLKSLEKNLTKIELCEPLNLIYSLKELRIEAVDSFLNNINYEQVIHSETSRIINTVNSGQTLSEEDCKIYEMILNYYVDSEYKESWYKYIFSTILRRKSNFSYDFVKQIVTEFVITIEKQMFENPEFKFESLTGNTRGITSNEGKTIKIDNKVFDNFYYNGYEHLFITIFHEISHACQYYRHDIKRTVSLSDILQIKEKIIHNLNEEYYSDNYFKISYEIEADAFGHIWFIKFIESLGLKIEPPDDLKKYIKVIAEQTKDIMRNYKGDRKTVNQIFDELIYDKPEFLTENYPQLFFEYTIDDGKVRRKTFNEINEDFNQIDFLSLSENERIGVDELYDYLFKNAGEMKSKHI